MTLSKQNVRKIFDDPSTKYFSLVNDVLSLATIVSILAIVLETVPSFDRYETIFLITEWVAVILFSLEYVFRLWSSKKLSNYALSPYGVIDLVAILPTLFGLGNLSFLKSARIVRIIRFLRLARLTKLSRIDTKDAEETIGVFGFNIALYAVTLVLVMLVLGVALHLFISEEGQYWSIPAGMYWAFSVFLGGLPAPVPEGSVGTMLFILAKFCGMALFGLLVGVVGKIFNQWILGKKE
jgi:voltage-gated potassium channel